MSSDVRIFLLLLSVVLVASAAIARAPGARALADRSLEFEVQAADGTRVQLRFSVRAESEAGAYEAAMAATEALLPGARPVAGEVSAQFAFWSWAWPDSMLPVPLWYNPSGAPSGAGQDTVRAAIAPWNAVVTSRFRIDYQGETAASPGLQRTLADGLNTVGWQVLPCVRGVNCALGVTSKIDSAREVDITLNGNPEARRPDPATADVPDIQTTLVHELGHLGGLEHSCYPARKACTPAEAVAAMYPSYRGLLRELQPDDVAGISALYPAAGSIEGQVGTVPLGDPSTVAYPVALQPGWTLVVLPPSELAGTMSLLACAEAVYSWQEGGWLTWLRAAPPALNGLKATDGERAYWVYASGACGQTFTAARFS